MTLAKNKNFLQPSGFKVIIDQRYQNLEFFAQSVTHPSSSVNAVEFGVPKLNSFSFAGDKVNYDDLNINLILDEDMVVYKEMSDWMERSINDLKEIECDITVIILSSHNNKNIEISYKNCIPTNIGSFELNSISGDLNYITVDTTFKFTHFTIK